MNNYTVDGYKRTSQPAARKLFEQGKTFYIQSCNMMPINPWQSAHAVDPQHCKDNDYTFDNFVNNYEYYHTDNERGLYSSFYIKE